MAKKISAEYSRFGAVMLLIGFITASALSYFMVSLGGMAFILVFIGRDLAEPGEEGLVSFVFTLAVISALIGAGAALASCKLYKEMKIFKLVCFLILSIYTVQAWYAVGSCYFRYLRSSSETADFSIGMWAMLLFVVIGGTGICLSRKAYQDWAELRRAGRPDRGRG